MCAMLLLFVTWIDVLSNFLMKGQPPLHPPSSTPKKVFFFIFEKLSPFKTCEIVSFWCFVYSSESQRGIYYFGDHLIGQSEC